jgi:hypothetical protein
VFSVTVLKLISVEAPLDGGTIVSSTSKGRRHTNSLLSPILPGLCHSDYYVAVAILHRILRVRPMHAVAISLAITVAMEANLEGQLMAYPPREVVNAQIEFAKRYFKYLLDKEHVTQGRTPFYLWIIDQQDYIKEACWPWLELRSAQSDVETLSRKMAALERVRLFLLTTQGRMPPIVAYWKFREGPPPPNPRLKLQSIEESKGA